MGIRPRHRNRAATILQPDLGRSGGILETKKIAAMAEAYHIQIAPHCYCGPIVGAANIQLAATLPNFLILESLKQWDGFWNAEAVGRLPRNAAEEEDRMAGRPCHPVEGAGDWASNWSVST
jgi:L-alanine-DL-glutamate epimerase-like enolase superfamily enzyme